MWTGARKNASDPATFGLWISGHNSIEALIDDFSSTNRSGHNMAMPGSTVILSGGSAGGIGAFNNVDFVADKLPNSLVLGAPVGGFPPEVNWYTGKGSTVPDEDARDSSFWKNEAFWGSYQQEKCVAELSPVNETDLCTVPYRLYDHLKTPVFIVEAITDAVVMCGFEGLPCKPEDLLLADVRDFIDDYAANFTQSAARLFTDTPRNGLFAASCLMHTGFELTEPLVNGTNAIDATFEWYKYHAEQFQNKGTATRHRDSAKASPNFVWMDTCKDGKYFPPCDAKCPPTPTEDELSGPYIF